MGRWSGLPEQCLSVSAAVSYQSRESREESRIDTRWKIAAIADLRSLQLDGLYGVLQCDGWQGDKIVFIGKLTMRGVGCELRHTLTKKPRTTFPF
jgi:hypothetical protein